MKNRSNWLAQERWVPLMMISYALWQGHYGGDRQRLEERSILMEIWRG